MKSCAVIGCGRRLFAAGLCPSHYNWSRLGIDPATVKIRAWRAPISERLWSHIDVRGPDECWPWTGKSKIRDYGCIGNGGRSFLAHRVAWELTNGPIPEGLNVLHSCDNPPCCNPGHLFLGTQKDNVDDMISKGRMRHCRGEKHAHKIVDDDALVILARRRSGESPTLIAATFGVTPALVYAIESGAVWSHVTGLPKRAR